jgi:hypothetical protein
MPLPNMSLKQAGLSLPKESDRCAWRARTIVQRHGAQRPVARNLSAIRQA